VLCQVLAGLVKGPKEEEIKSALDLLAEHEFILHQPNSEDAYQFKHVLVSDAVYSTLLQRDRRELHTRVGQTIEKIFAGRLDTQIEVLAGHFLRSPLQDRALYYLTMAGQKAARSYANDQARVLFSQALEVLPRANPTPEQATAVYLGLGDAMLTAGEYQPAREQFLSALKELGEPTGTGMLRPLDEVLADESPAGEERVRTLSLLQRKIGTTHERQGDYERAMTCLRSAQSLIEFRKSTFVAERASIMNDIGFIDFRRGNLDRAEALLREAFALAESIHQYDLVGSVLNRLAGIYFQRDQVEPATRYLKRSLELREKIGDVVAVARSYNNLGLLSWKQGDLLKALEYFDRCYTLQSNLGDVEGMIVLHTNMGLIELDRGRLVEAEDHFQQALSSAGEIGHSYYVCLSRMNLALMGVYTGDWPQVLEQGQLSLAGFEELSVQEHLLDLYWVMAWGYRGTGDPAKLEEALQKIRDLLAQEAASRPAGKTVRPSEGEGRALRLFARVARDHGEMEPAREMLINSAAIFTSLGSQMERSRSILDLASLMASCGEKKESRALLAEARDIFQKMGARLDLERVRAIEELL
jgi:tetratricopeptide (TPR) repeat protein